MTDLATIDDLEARLGRDLTTAEAAKAPGALKASSVKIRGFCRRDFTANTNDEVVLRPVGTLLTLANTPIASVVQVEMIGAAGTPDRVMGITEWRFDGINKIELFPCTQPYNGAIPSGTYANTYRVTTNNGGVVPDFIVQKTVDVALRAILAPTQVEGLVSERIGQYAYQYGQAPGMQSSGVTVRLTKEDRDELREAGYRRSSSTIQTRAG